MPQDWEPANWAEGFAARAGREIARLRLPKSTQSLSDRTAELGFRVSRSVITDIENGRRKYIATHELVIIAAALGVAPTAIIFGNDDGQQVELIPGQILRRLDAIQAFTGTGIEELRRYEQFVADAQAGVLAMAEAAKLTREALHLYQDALWDLKYGDGG